MGRLKNANAPANIGLGRWDGFLPPGVRPSRALQHPDTPHRRSAPVLGHLVELLREATNQFLTIEFDLHGAETILFPTAEALAATDEILADNGLRNQGSRVAWRFGKKKVKRQRLMS